MIATVLQDESPAECRAFCLRAPRPAGVPIRVLYSKPTGRKEPRCVSEGCRWRARCAGRVPPPLPPLPDAATEVIKGGQTDKVVVETELLAGIPKHAVVDEAERWGADLVVVGSHGYSGFERFLLGSVSQSIAHHARCSVLIVRCRPSKAAS